MILHTRYGETEPVELGEGRGDLNYTSYPLTEWDGGPLFRDRPVSYARIFAEQTWIAIAVMRMLTWSVRVPLKAYERLDDEGDRRRLRPSDHALAAAVVEPWERGTQAGLVTGALGPLLVHGNGLTDVHSGAGDRISFEHMDWRSVKPIRLDPDDRFSPIVGWEVYDVRGAKTEVRSSDTVQHLAWWSPLGNLGVSPLRQLGSTIEAERAAKDWTLHNLVNSARPSGVITTKPEWLGLEKTQRETLFANLRKDITEIYAGPVNAGRPPILPPGLDWETTPHQTAVEAALIEQRKVNREESAAIYMLPPPMIGILDHATYSNVQQAREMAYTDGLAPPLILLEQLINAHVCRGLLATDAVFVEFDFAGILRGDRLKEIQAIREAVASAILTPNEGRELTGRRRFNHSAADELYLPSNNLRPLSNPDGNRVRDKALAAQQFGNAVKDGIVSRDEAREDLGYGGEGGEGDTDQEDDES